VEETVEFPGLVWVKDPVDRVTGELTGGPPRRRHHDECWHFERDTSGNMLGPPPYRASDELMHTLPACQDCAETQPGGGRKTISRQGKRGDVCPNCFMEMPVTGGCPNCGEI
jgi:hypothetical protein